MMEKHLILGVHVTDRINNISEVQQVLTEYGCNIKTRLGLHDADKNFCSPTGLLILEMISDSQASNEMSEKLNAVEGVEVQTMLFDHP
jgi:hypothetical protein